MVIIVVHELPTKLGKILSGWTWFIAAIIKSAVVSWVEENSLNDAYRQGSPQKDPILFEG